MFAGGYRNILKIHKIYKTNITGQKEKDGPKMGLSNKTNAKANIKERQAENSEKVLNIGKSFMITIGMDSAKLGNETCHDFYGNCCYQK